MKRRPVFADPKTDIIFKKIFGQKSHEHLLIELLNALLELDEPHRIVELEYLSSEQLPPRRDLKLSILDVKCTDAQGTRYVVEMQIIEVEGFQKRVVYNACKAYATQLGVGDNYPKLNDVIAVTLTDFVLWPKQEGGAWRVPMLSRWRLQEQHGGEIGLGEVQYVFLELPKYQGGDKPRTLVDKWTYFFRAAPSLERVPPELSEAPFAQALEVARVANLSEDEWTEYEREKMAEQDFRGGLALAEKRAEERGEKRGEERGEKRGEKRGEERGALLLRQAIRDLCELLGIPMTDERAAALEQMSLADLDTLRQHLKQARDWPAT